MVKRKKPLKKNSDQDSPGERRMKDKDGEVAIARGRLAGALKGILNRHPDDSDEQDSSYNMSQSSTSNINKLTHDSPPTQWKKQKSVHSETEDHQSYLMKLFDRSVDLAQFDIETPLYPICRAWIKNQPSFLKKSRDGLLEIKHDNGGLDSQLYKVHESNINMRQEEDDVYHLPIPKPLPEGVTTLRIPSPAIRQIQEINLISEPNQVLGKEELLQYHLQNWVSVRKRWRQACQKNEERYAESKAILADMFERAQVQFNVP